ncbi:hypothetical protein NLG97_g10120 [Lecanicillium saksenae]|uniref:Uncharacterized protein n=1 Tax=Lecanicillium saksenae TaxID=468837 RepID=A0ACC1QG32_9HYPO|nr:hypothetical protein NLG97_g10120 [Lecanicillium saksenae]
MAGSLSLGSAAWTNGQEYGDQGEHAERIRQFIDAINQEALLSYASSLRDHQPCALSASFSVGHSNLVRKIQFRDGVAWAARLRMPLTPDGGDATTTTSSEERTRREMQSELATMEFVRYAGSW